jgi:DNA-binding CsgD family transcriptional regulator
MGESARSASPGIDRRREEARESAKGGRVIPDRETMAGRLAAKGHADKEIAHLLGISLSTTTTHLADLYRKYDLSGWGNSRVRLARLLWREKAILRCEREMSAIDALPLDGPTGPTEIGPTLGWIDNWLERELLEGKS